MIKQEFVADAVEFVSCHTGSNVGAHFNEGLGRKLCATPNAFDDLITMDVAACPPARGLLAHVLWAGYGGGHFSPWGHNSLENALAR